MIVYKYEISRQCYEEIYAFYYHVALKYRHTYSEELMHKNIDDAIDFNEMEEVVASFLPFFFLIP